jgi:hypothetical protein
VLTFNYTVVAGDASSDLNYAATNSLTLNSGTIKDAATNSANVTLPGLATANSLAGSKDIVVDTTAPSVAATAAGGAFADGSATWETGFVSSGGKYYIYANVTDNVGVGSVNATVTDIAGSATTVPLSSGSWSISKPGGGSVLYNYRSAVQTAGTLNEPPATAPTFTVSAMDTATNPVGPVAGSSVTVDNTAPTPLTINEAAATGHAAKFTGTAGKATGDNTSVTVVVCTTNTFPCTGTLNATLTPSVSSSTGNWPPSGTADASSTTGGIGNGTTHFAQVSQSDAAGNVSKQTTAQFTT